MTHLHRPRAASGRAALGAPRLLLAALVILLGCSGVFTPQVPAQGLVMRDVSFPIQDLRFPSGLRVLVEKDSRAPLVGLFLVVGAGSTSDPPGKEGLAHYIEHLTFRSRPYGKYSLQRMMERGGASAWNAFTSLDDTVYYELGAASDLANMLRLEGARMTAPVSQLSPETLATELKVVRNELRQRNETGYVGEVMSTLQAAVFPSDHPYARPVIGSHASLNGFNIDDIKEFLQKNYRPDNMTLVVLGDVDPASMSAVLQETLPPALLSAPTPVHPGPRMAKVGAPPPAPPPGELARKEGSVATPELWIAWSLPRSFDTESYLIEFVQRAATEQLASAAREDEDIAYVTTSIVEGAQASMLLCRAVLHRGVHPERSVDHVLNRLSGIWMPAGGAASVQVTEIGFAERQRGAVVGMMLSAENLLSRGVDRATATHFSQDPALYSRGLRDVMALEQRRVLDYAYQYLTRDRARAVLFTPPAGGSVLPESQAISAPAIDEEDTRPILVDEKRLRAIAPGPGASAYRRVALANGLEVIAGRREGLPLVSVGLLFPGGQGAAPDPVAQHAADFLAKPRQTRNGSPSAYGGRMRWGTSRDGTLVQLDGAAGNVTIMLASLAERVRSMYVPTDTWPWYQREVVPFVRLADQKPETIADWAFMAALFPDHPYGKAVTGKDLEGVSSSAAEAWVDATYAPDRAVLVVVGEIDPDEVMQTADQFFGPWGKGASALTSPSAPVVSPAGTGGTQLVATHRPGATQSQIRFGCLLPAVDQSAMDTRHDVSAQLIEDRLMRVLRQKLGVTYGISTNAFLLRGGSAYLSIRGAVANAELGPALTVLKETLEGFAAAPPADLDLAWAKLRRARGEASSFMTTQVIVTRIMSSRNMGFAVGRSDGYAGELAAVTAEMVKQDFGYCMRGRPTLSIVGDEASARKAFSEAWK